MKLEQKRITALEKELAYVIKQEKRLEKAALKAKPSSIKSQLVAKVPAKVYSGLESAFCKGFSMVFDQGKSIIELSYKRNNIYVNHSVNDYAFDVKGARKELRKMNKSAVKSGMLNMALTSVEGIALGALGIGMPDIVLFLAMLLKGTYETALNYGFDYSSSRERLIILRMMETSLANGEDWIALNEKVDALFTAPKGHSQEEFDLALRSCASAFATDMLLLKFIQGLPVVGILGGAANPVYYNKVMKYVKLKYRKHYLLKKLR